MVVSEETGQRGSGLSVLGDWNHELSVEDPIISVFACEFPSEAGHGLCIFSLVKGDFCLFQEKGIDGGWEKEDFEEELKSELEEKRNTELEEGKNLSWEKSQVSLEGLRLYFRLSWLCPQIDFLVFDKENEA